MDEYEKECFETLRAYRDALDDLYGVASRMIAFLGQYREQIDRGMGYSGDVYRFIDEMLDKMDSIKKRVLNIDRSIVVKRK